MLSVWFQLVMQIILILTGKKFIVCYILTYCTLGLVFYGEEIRWRIFGHILRYTLIYFSLLKLTRGNADTIGRSNPQACFQI